MTYQARETSALSGAPVELYRFAVNNLVFRYTTADTAQTYLSEVYEPAPITRTAPEQQRDPSSSKLTVTVPRDNAVAMLFRGFAPAGTVGLTIFRFHRTDAETVILWTGRVRAASWSASTATLECDPIVAQMKRDALRLQYQVQCNHVLYGARCGLNPDSFKVVTTVGSVSDAQVTSPAFATRPDQYFRAGLLVHGFERKMIVAHVGATVTLFTPIEDMMAGDSVQVYAGCDRWLSTCRDRFSNAVNYGGFPFIPGHNPFNGIG